MYCRILPETASNNRRLWEKRSAEDVITYIVCHCIDGESIGDIEHIFQTFVGVPGYGVSAHFVVTQDGSIYNTVDVGNVAYHAGPSQFCTNMSSVESNRKDRRLNATPDTLTLNYISIGIEFVCPGYAKGGADWFHFESYTELQIKAGIALIQQLIDQFAILPSNVIGHSDCSPFRMLSSTSTLDGKERQLTTTTVASITHTVLGKTDPGPKFFWKELYRHGIGLPLVSTEASAGTDMSLIKANISEIQSALRTIGYTMVPESGVLDKETIYVILAFQAHFVPERILQDPQYPHKVLEESASSDFLVTHMFDASTLVALSMLSNTICSR